MRRLLALAAVVQAILVSVAHAATIDVTKTDDVLAADGQCSLREAVRSANLDAAQFGGAGECAAGDLADTIRLPAGTFTLSIPGTTDQDALSGDLDLLAPVTIVGAGAASTVIDANRIDRVLDVKTGVAVNLQGLTITGGKVPDGTSTPDVHGDDGAGGNATAASAGPGQRGGGIASAGSLTITDCVIVNNEAGSGGKGGNAGGGFGFTPSSPGPGQTGGTGYAGDGGSGGDGGGIYSIGSLTLVRVRVVGNKAGAGGAGGNAGGGAGGGGFSDYGGSGGNAFAGDGGGGGDSGGIHQIGGATLVIQQSEISGNTAGSGGSGGTASGGYGNVGSSFSGTGGQGYGGIGGDGGNAGGIVVGATASISRTLVAGNHAGDGGNGGNGTGGQSQPLIGGSGSAGDGGPGYGASGGDGGDGGGAWSADLTATNVTLADNASGSGGSAGNGVGGKGGSGGSFGAAGDGGAGTGGDGGSAGNGGAVLLYGSVTVEHATITGNALGASKGGGTGTGGAPGANGTSAGSTGSATNGASAVTAQGGAMSRFTGSGTIGASIIAGNTSPACGGGSISGDNDISFGDPSCPGANADPLLGPLADNGGPTLTRRPGDGSPAIDAAPADGCPATDQRGAARPFGAGCDIGAYERAAPLVAITAAAATVQGTVNPNARAATYHFEFGTTAAYGSATPDVSLPAGADAVPVSAALEGLAPTTTYHVRLVATNTDGTSATGDSTFTTTTGGQGGDTTAPAFLSASMKPKTFAVNRKGSREKLVTAKVKRGTTFRYRLSEAARVVFTIQRKKGKRFVQAKRFAKRSKAGANTKKFSGRIGKRALKPGRYRATLVATDAAGNRSKAKRLTFRIVR